MGFIKKHLFLILCALVVLLGAGLFAYGMMVARKNEQQNQTIQSVCDKVDKLGSNVVYDNELTQIKLDAKKTFSDAETVLALAKDTSARPLMYPDIFPEPRGESLIIKYDRFARTYLQIVEDYLQQLRAGDRPSTIEIDKVLEDFRRSSEIAGGRSAGRMPAMPGMPGMPGMIGGGAMRRSSSRTGQEEKLIDDLRRQKAQACLIYANNNAFCCYDYWKYHESTDKDTMLLQESASFL